MSSFLLSSRSLIYKRADNRLAICSLSLSLFKNVFDVTEDKWHYIFAKKSYNFILGFLKLVTVQTILILSFSF